MEYINKLLHRPAAKPPTCPPNTSQTASDASFVKSPEHKVKVQFTREFVDVPVPNSAVENLSEASSFQSLTSTQSFKSTRTASPEPVFGSPNKPSDISYVNREISGLDDLISACANIQLEESVSALYVHNDRSQDQSFASAKDESIVDTLAPTKDQSVVGTPTSAKSKSVVNTPASAKAKCITDIPKTEQGNDVTFVTKTDESPLPTPLALQPYVENNPVCCVEKKPDEGNESPSGTVCNENLNDTLTLSAAGISDLTGPTTTVFGTESNNFLTQVPLHDNDKLQSNRDLDKTIELTQPRLLTRSETFTLPSELESIDNLPSLALSDFTRTYNTASGECFPTTEVEDEKSAESPPLPGNETFLLPEEHKTNVNDASPKNTSFTISTEQKTNERNIANDTIVLDFKPQTSDLKAEQSLQRFHTAVQSPFKEKFVSTDNTDLEFVSCTDNDTGVVEFVKNKVVKTESTEDNTQFPKDAQPSGSCLNQTVSIEEATSNEECHIENPFVTADSDLKNLSEDLVVSSAQLDDTLTFEDQCVNLLDNPEQEPEDFKPQRYSTELSLANSKNFGSGELPANAFANDIFESAGQVSQENEHFISATDDIFRDPKSFDYLLTASRSTQSNKRFESLYVKFDPLVANTSMLPQSNNASANEEHNEKNASPVAILGTPKRNPAIAAIDRLLLYSPMSPAPDKAKTTTPEIKQESKEEPVTESTPVVDENMAKELEVVRSTVLQLEEELEKLKISHKEEMEKQKTFYEERMCQLQKQLEQEKENGHKMTVVVDEYEKSISRLIAETERDRAVLEKEREKLQEELQAANHHLNNTEAAFNDVHLKYERLKGVVSAYKSNEVVLKESIQENEETIKALEKCYDKLKSHAIEQLEKANQELDAIRKQNEAETVRLKAMVRKAELKSNSLAELVEQKTKENKELTQILDEVIGRVGSGHTE